MKDRKLGTQDMSSHVRNQRSDEGCPNSCLFTGKGFNLQDKGFTIKRSINWHIIQEEMSFHKSCNCQLANVPTSGFLVVSGMSCGLQRLFFRLFISLGIPVMTNLLRKWLPKERILPLYILAVESLSNLGGPHIVHVNPKEAVLTFTVQLLDC